MESLQDKLDRTQGDLNKIIDLYDFAEKLYPYENIRGPLQVKQRLNYSLKIVKRE
jgi:hypothetical protein